MTLLDRSIQGLISAIGEISFNVLPTILYIAVAIGVMLNLEWRLTLLAVCFVPLPVLIASFAASTQSRREKTLLESWAKIYSRFNEVLSGIITVRSFAMEDVEKSRFLRHVGKVNRIVIKGVGFDSTIGGLQNLTVVLARI